MRIGEKTFIYTWMGHFGLSLAAYGGIPMPLRGPSPCHFLGEGHFFKNRPCAGQKAILTTIVQIAQRPQKWSLSVPRGPIDPHLSWFGRRKLLGEYKKSTFFGVFGNFEASHKYGLYPPPKYGQRYFDIRNRSIALGTPILTGKVHDLVWARVL